MIKDGKTVGNKNCLENEVESYLRRQVQLRGGQCLKFLSDYKVGMPDRIVLLPGGKVIWVELKRPKGGRLSPTQLVCHADLRKLGQRVEVVNTKEAVDALLKKESE